MQLLSSIELRQGQDRISSASSLSSTQLIVDVRGVCFFGWEIDGAGKAEWVWPFIYKHDELLHFQFKYNNHPFVKSKRM